MNLGDLTQHASPVLAAISGSGVLQLALYIAVLIALVKPLGWFMARVLEGRTGEAPLGLGRLLGWVEHGTCRLCGNTTEDAGAGRRLMGWRGGQMGEERSFYQYIPVMPNSWLPAFPLFPYSFPSLPSFLTEPQDPLVPSELGKTSNE